MKDRKHLLLTIVLVALLVGCAGGENAPTTTIATMPTTRPAPSTAVTIPVIATTAVPTVPPTQPPVITVYAGAMEDYLLPLETFSDERLYTPEMIMLHFCSAVQLDESDPYNMELVRSTFVDNEVSTHYIIERDGTVRCYIPEDRVAWHAGRGKWLRNEKYSNVMNQYAIGIELVAMGSKYDMAPYMKGHEYDAMDQRLMGFTEAQYEALQALLNDLCLRYDIPLDRDHVIGHQEYAKSKRDPGELFDWTRIVP